MDIRRTQIAYRCPACAEATVGFLGGLTAAADMLRLKCSCGESALDITKRRGGGIHLSVPCVYCGENHGTDISEELVGRDALTALPCPFSGMDIAFIGSDEQIASAVTDSAAALGRIMTALEAEEISDIQPREGDADDTAIDPAVFDTINFIVRDLESEGQVKCPCGATRPALRYTDSGIQVYCESCGASRDITALTPTAAEEYLTLSEIILA
ncbi:MAG: hypothetical protein IKA64_03715 [Clostridia bacterium]|nr:hypothetical protein [Clostridia bacterium]